MIQFPKEISKILKSIEEAGFEAYAVGGCVRDALLGKRAKDWDITTNAPLKILMGIFPEANVISEKMGVVQIAAGELSADIALYRIDGKYVDRRRPESVTFTDKLEEDLKRRDFGMNAIAVNLEKGVVDLCDGRSDIKNKIIKAVGNPLDRFEEDALRILRGIRFAAQLDFTVEAETLAAMKNKINLLEEISFDRIRIEFVKTITAKNASKGLALLIETGALEYILGQESVKHAGKSELNRLKILVQNIDETKSDQAYRIALLYLCFEKAKSLKSIEKLNYDSGTKAKLKAAITDMEELESVKSKVDLKEFISRVGMEMYLYLDSLSKQQNKIYNTEDFKLLSRSVIFDEIKSRKEPIFIEDLAVNGSDLLGIGIPQGEDIGKTLKLLLTSVHKNPADNNRENLLKKAKSFRKNPVGAILRGTKW